MTTPSTAPSTVPLGTEIPMPHTYLLKRFNVSRTTFWRWRKAGLPCQVVAAKIFVKESDIVRFIAEQDTLRKTTSPLPHAHVQD